MQLESGRIIWLHLLEAAGPFCDGGDLLISSLLTIAFIDRETDYDINI
ncbi:MAG: hypothetical protein WC344_05120 [Bacilli bacterium]|jgi:hypothetical protein